MTYTILDVGARWGVDERWASLAPDVQIYGFDPDEDECERLNLVAEQSGKSFVRYVPVALGASSVTVAFYPTIEPACSSMYPPIPKLAATFPGLECTTSTSLETIALRPLDEWCSTNNVGPVDYLKLDVQGAELDVLRGADDTLTTVSLLEVEVEFNPIYEGQPLFGDIDRHLRERGFVLWRLDNLVHYAAGPAVDERSVTYFDWLRIETERPGGQIYWAHATYARADLCPGTSGPLDPERRNRVAQLADVAGVADLAAYLRAGHEARRFAGTDQMSTGPQGQTTAELHEMIDRQHLRIDELESLQARHLQQMDELVESAVLSDERAADAAAHLELIQSTRTWRLRGRLLRLGPLRTMLSRGAVPSNSGTMT